MDYDGDGSQDNEHYTSVNAMSKEKRICHRHSPQQIQMLEAHFKECPHPNESQRQKFCNELNLEIDQVKFWFQNKRTRSKAQDERTSNILLRAENEKLQCENAAMLEALKNVTCPPCGGPPFGREEREPNLHKLRLENPLFKAEISHNGLWKGRFGDGVGGCPSCKEDGTPCRNTWQHLRTAPSFSDAAMHIIAEGGYKNICQ
ncbi:hypothetical protein F2Q70_00014525 [Brassica cretica]|uniref:Homeobox domain-containing protein n=1 Tax=Brassica cretica TaxID=69181 RepID=A0A8S9I258_BRACR|nr:hypothetical protein F2Q70_00014525 [Brassica cretica]